MTVPVPPIAAPSEPSAAGATRRAEIRAAATAFEAVFLAEMLKHTGLAEPPAQFGGGVGERQMAPLLVREYAQALADKGGIGLADRLAEALAARDR
ncbi:MAG: rod-binding protein [Pikeienuella sp.]